MNVDILTNLDLPRMIATHQDSNAVATLAVIKRESSRQLLLDETMTLCGWVNNATNQQRISRQAEPMLPYGFSGIQVLSGKIFKDIPFEGKFSLIDLYLHLAKTQVLKGYDHTGNIFIDVGKPESIEQAEYLFQ